MICSVIQWTVFYMIETSAMKELNVSRNIDAIRYINNKMTPVRWVSQQYLEFTHSPFNFFLTFSLLYLFKCRFVDLRQNWRTRKIGRVSEVLRAGACPIGIGRAICPGPDKYMGTL